MVNITEKELRHMESAERKLAGDEVHHLAEAVYHHKDGIKSSLGPREAQNKVHANARPWGIGDG